MLLTFVTYLRCLNYANLSLFFRVSALPSNLSTQSKHFKVAHFIKALTFYDNTSQDGTFNVFEIVCIEQFD